MNAVNEELDMTDKDMGRVLTRMRMLAGWSKAQLGRHLGISYQAVQSMEIGRTRLPATRLLTIAGALGISVDDMIDTVRDPQHKLPRHEHDEAINLLYALTQASEHHATVEPDRQAISRAYDLFNRIGVTKDRPRWEL